MKKENVSMKITILDKKPDEEDEIIVKCSTMDEQLIKLLNSFKQGSVKLNGYADGKIHLIEAKNVFYFESVDQKVFVYCKTEVYEIKSKLYELEDELPAQDFLRSSKSTILNLNQIQNLTPAFNGRFEALLKNGEKAIISRQYVATLKEKLGL